MEISSLQDGNFDRIQDGSRFDYKSVPLPVAKFLQGQADRIRRHCAVSTIQIGKALIEAKRHLSHGEFLQWVESEVCIPARTAQAYMRIANWAADKGAAVAHLSPSALYLLSSSRTPSEYVTSVLGRMEAGEFIAPSTMRGELKGLRRGEQEKSAISPMSAVRSEHVDTIKNVVRNEPESGGNGRLSELVSILLQVLPPADFARIRDIMTSDAVVADPQLAQKLKQAFECMSQFCSALI